MLPPKRIKHPQQIQHGELIGGNKQAMATLQEQGSCDISYSLPAQCRFRVNIFVQRGSHAIVMRVIPKSIPSFVDLKLPPQLGAIANLRNGIVLVTGPTGSGKSSTMAAIPDRISETQAHHIITIKDPVAFMHDQTRQSRYPATVVTSELGALQPFIRLSVSDFATSKRTPHFLQRP